jgi:hypothetical protein
MTEVSLGQTLLVNYYTNLQRIVYAVLGKGDHPTPANPPDPLQVIGSEKEIAGACIAALRTIQERVPVLISQFQEEFGL